VCRGSHCSGYFANVACTCESFVIVKLQVGFVPEQAPLQLTNGAMVGEALTVTVDPGASFAEHAPGQAMLPSAVVTVPLLLMPIESVTGFAAVVVPEASAANAAPTVRCSLTTSVQEGAVPAHAPDHPAKTFPDDGAATSVAVAPIEYAAAHVEPHDRSRSTEATLPAPVRVTLIDGTTTLAAVICALRSAPTSPAAGDAQFETAHSAWRKTASYLPVY